jgi:hypothetical protein
MPFPHCAARFRAEREVLWKSSYMPVYFSITEPLKNGIITKPLKSE